MSVQLMRTQRLPSRRAPIKTLSWNGKVGIFLLLLVIIPSLLAPWLAPYAPTAMHNDNRFVAPNAEYLFGTDILGRDQLSRVLYGGRTAMSVALLVLTTSVTVGTIVGCLAGYYGGVVDEIISWILYVILTLPGISLTIALVAFLGPGMTSLFLAMSATAWAGYARLFRGAVLSTRRQLYVEAARASGATDWRILLHHIAPNVARPILALASLNLSSVMLGMAGLSFLGLGVQPPLADWGTMLSDIRPYFWTQPYLAVPPALCIVLVSLGSTLLADALLADNRRS